MSQSHRSKRYNPQKPESFWSFEFGSRKHQRTTFATSSLFSNPSFTVLQCSCFPLRKSCLFAGGPQEMCILGFILGVLGQVLLEILIANSWGGPPTSTNLCNGDVKSQTGWQAAGPNAGWPASQGLVLSSAMGSKSKLQTRWWTGLGRFKYQTIMHSRIHLTASQQLILVINQRWTLGANAPARTHGTFERGLWVLGSSIVFGSPLVVLFLDDTKHEEVYPTILSDDNIRNISVYQKKHFAGLLSVWCHVSVV